MPAGRTPWSPKGLGPGACASGTGAADLDPAGDAGAVHPTGHIHGVAPDVVLRPASPDHTGHHGAHVDAWKTSAAGVPERLPGDVPPLPDRRFRGSLGAAPLPDAGPPPPDPTLTVLPREQRRPPSGLWPRKADPRLWEPVRPPGWDLTAAWGAGPRTGHGTSGRAEGPRLLVFTGQGPVCPQETQAALRPSSCCARPPALVFPGVARGVHTTSDTGLVGAPEPGQWGRGAREGGQDWTA